MPLDLGGGLGGESAPSFEGGGEEPSIPTEESSGGEEGGELPSPADLGVDFTDNSQS